MEGKDLIPSNDSMIMEPDSFNGLHMKKAENKVSDHESGSVLSAEEATTQRFSWSLRKVTILASLCLDSVFSYEALSMIAPFYPHEAEVRGVSTAVVGLIFGTYPFMVFIFAPICGLLIAKYGPNRVLLFGMFSGGTSLITFIFCAWISSSTEFVVLSFLLRALSAFGGAASETAVMSIVIEEFPDRLGMASGLIETFVGVGFSLGPVLGGFLYTVGGFHLPFVVIGCSMIAVIPVLFCVLSRDGGVHLGKTPDREKISFPIAKALKIPSVLMIVVCFATAGASISFPKPILGPYLERMMNLNATQIGLVFLVNAAIYALTTPLAGWIGDKTSLACVLVHGYHRFYFWNLFCATDARFSANYECHHWSDPGWDYRSARWIPMGNGGSWYDLFCSGMNTDMERKDAIPSDDSIESESSHGLHMKKAVTEVSDHELGSALSAEEATTQRFSWSFYKVVILASLCLVIVLSFAALTMIAPFYPHEAEVRGVSTAVVGLIFGTYPFMVFIFAPICGLLIAKYDPNRVLLFGMFAAGTSLITFNFCAWISSTTEFVVLSFLLRVLTALGGAASETAVMTIVIEEFPDRIGMTSGFIETFVGVGFSLGPVLGGGLYTVGGFQLPFVVLGCSMIAAIPVLFCVLSRRGVHSGKTPDQEKASFPIIEALKIPAVLMIAVCFATGGITQSYLEPILGPHLERMMNLNATQIGLVFLVNAAMYALTAPLAGWIGDKTQCHRWITVSGYTGYGFGSFLLGPAPFLTFFLPVKRVWLVCLSMAITGFSAGIYFVQLMPDLVKIMRNNGMPDNSATRGVISSIFSGMLNLGATIGPTLAGIIDQHIGFRWAMVVLGIICFSQAVVLAVFTLLERTEAGRWRNTYSSIPDSSDEEEFEELVLDSARENETD
ncbi:uncharacterized protein LOC144646870 [Oculina patagonica]